MGDTLDIPYHLFRLLCPGFGLPEPIIYLLSHGLTPFLRSYFISSGRQEQAPMCPLPHVFYVSHLCCRFTHADLNSIIRLFESQQFDIRVMGAKDELAGKRSKQKLILMKSLSQYLRLLRGSLRSSTSFSSARH